MKHHDAVIQGCELKAKELGLPFNVVSPQTFAKPDKIKINRKLWDFVVFLPHGQTLWFEVKIPPDDYTDGQRELLHEMLQFDVPCFKIKSVDEFYEDICLQMYETGITWEEVNACHIQL